jgi:hypothetical protein
MTALAIVSNTEMRYPTWRWIVQIGYDMRLSSHVGLVEHSGCREFVLPSEAIFASNMLEIVEMLRFQTVHSQGTDNNDMSLTALIMRLNWAFRTR